MLLPNRRSRTVSVQQEVGSFLFDEYSLVDSGLQLGLLHTCVSCWLLKSDGCYTRAVDS